MEGPGRSRSGLVFALVGAAILALAGDVAEACVGARPLAMGGAFIAVADDSSSTYWNPAGLATLERSEISATYTANNRDRYNYDEFLSYAAPAGPAGAALGLSVISEDVGTRDGTEAYRASDWLVCSFAGSLSADLSIGANVRHETHARRSPGLAMVWGWRWGLDVGLLYRASDEISLGLLVQDLGLSSIHWETGSEEAVLANVRPAVAYRPDDRTVIALDIYDLGAFLAPAGSGRQGASAVRAGIERLVRPNVAARLGYYGIGPGVGAVTGGVGWEGRVWQVDYAYLGSGTMAGHPGLGGTHQIGVTLKF